MLDADSLARSLLADIRARAGSDVLLWRGPDLDGSDIDLLTEPDALTPLVQALVSAGLSLRSGSLGDGVWSQRGRRPVIDVTPTSAWPVFYPSLDGLRSRAIDQADHPPVASPEDRLLMLAAEAISGRPLAKLTERAARLLREPGVRERMHAVGGLEGRRELAALIGDPSRLAAQGRRGRLPYGSALRLAVRSTPARAALGSRIAARLRGLASMQTTASSRGSALLVTISGMDGAGKSTAARSAAEELERLGAPVEIAWRRIGQDAALLDALAGPVKRLLGRRGRIADPVAAGGPSVAFAREPVRGPLARVAARSWVVIVSAIDVRAYRRVARRRRSGVNVVCDRWLADSLVDLSLRYGRHRLAAGVLRRGLPTPDVGILLRVDAQTAAARKPGDQAEEILAAMESRYAALAAELSLIEVDATRPAPAVGAQIRALVQGAVAETDG